jgi:hypothetical protein
MHKIGACLQVRMQRGVPQRQLRELALRLLVRLLASELACTLRPRGYNLTNAMHKLYVCYDMQNLIEDVW